MTPIAPITGPDAPTVQTAQTPRSNALGQQDFLTLLTTQLKNQDPLKPLEDAEFLSQMAQFSTVSGIDRVNDTLSSLGAAMRDMRIAMATDMLGRSVLVPGAVAHPDAEGAIRGAVDLAAPVDSLTVTYADATTGEILHSQTLGPQPAGQAEFGWTDLPADRLASRAPVRVSLSAVEQGQIKPLDPQVYARVTAAQAGAQEVTVQVEGFGALNTLEISAFC